MAENNKIILSSSSSTSYISGLTDELLIEILCRIGSSKYATRCKCICKRWFSLIDTNTNPSSDSYFLRRWQRIHHKEEKELPMALLTQYSHSVSSNSCVIENFHVIDHCLNYNNELPNFKYLTFLPCSNNVVSTNSSTFQSPICILASFKDLVLCCPNKDDHSVYYICNLLTRQWTALPPPPSPPKEPIGGIYRVGLIISNETSPFFFKVVRFVPTYWAHKNGRNIFKMNVDIFSSWTGEWRHMIVSDEERHTVPPEVFFSSRLVSYNGMILWLSKNSDEIIGLNFNPNANTDSYAHLSLPPGLDDRGRAHLLGVCKGRLRIAHLVHRKNVYGLKLVIWELDRHRQCWMLVKLLELSEIEDTGDSKIIRSCYGDDIARSYVLAFHPYDEDILYLYFTPPRESIYYGTIVYSYIFMCDVRKRTLEAIRGLPTYYVFSSIGFPLVQPCWPTPIPLIPQP